MSDKVIGGTPQGFQSLCTTCRAAHRIRGLNLQDIVFCRAGQAVRVSFPVGECSLYDDKRVPSLYDMQQIAWEVKSRSRGASGFVGARDLTIEISPPDRSNGPQSPQPSNGQARGLTPSNSAKETT